MNKTDLKLLSIPYSNGIPCYWMNEQTGFLQQCVEAYFLPYGEVERTPPLEMSEDALLYLRSYLFHWADAPCYKSNPHATAETRAELEKLINAARLINSRKDIEEWTDQALELGIDPF